MATGTIQTWRTEHDGTEVVCTFDQPVLCPSGEFLQFVFESGSEWIDGFTGDVDVALVSVATGVTRWSGTAHCEVRRH